MAIMMKSNVYVVTEIKKSTTAYVFKNIELGDEVQMSIPVERVGHGSRGRTYAPEIKFVNLTKGEETTLTFNELPNRLENFELAERVGGLA